MLTQDRVIYTPQRVHPSKGAGAMFALLLTLLLSGCKTELYSELPETEGNEMYAILRSADIAVDKVVGKEQAISLTVPDHQIARAIRLLKSRGYPKDKFATIEEVFPKEGVISSPTEEKARFIYATSQDIAATLSNIDGILTSRVHVVLPEESRYSKDKQTSSASVFLKYSTGTPIENLTPKIKTLVANSIQGLNYENVSVALFPADEPTVLKTAPELTKVGFLQLGSDSVSRFYTLIVAVLTLLIGAIAGLIYALYKLRSVQLGVASNEQ